MSRKLLVPFELPANPTNPLEAATKQYVDALAGSEVEINVSDPIGTNPNAELWYDSDAVAAPVLASQVQFTPTGTIAATSVQSAIAEAASEALQTNVPWINLTLENSYTVTGGGEGPPQYRKVGDIVQLRGCMRKTVFTAGQTAFTMPVGYRPSYFTRHNLLVMAGGTAALTVARADLDTAGAYKPYAGPSDIGWWPLDAFQYSVL